MYNLMLPRNIDYGENSSACALLVQLKYYLVTIFIPSNWYWFKEGYGACRRLAPRMYVRNVQQPSLELTAVNFNTVLLHLFVDWY